MSFSIPLGTADITITFRRRSDDSLFDPQTPQCVVKNERGLQSLADLTRQSEGVYTATVDFDHAGQWLVIGQSSAVGEITKTKAIVVVTDV